MSIISSLSSVLGSSSSLNLFSSSSLTSITNAALPSSTGSSSALGPLAAAGTPTPSISSASTSATAAPTLHIVPSVANYNYFGCYTEGTGVRALTPGAFAADTMTVESCEASCAGYTYFGVEYGRECKLICRTLKKITNKP
jgi:hypothetical protein